MQSVIQLDTDELEIGVWYNWSLREGSHHSLLVSFRLSFSLPCMCATISLSLSSLYMCDSPSLSLALSLWLILILKNFQGKCGQ